MRRFRQKVSREDEATVPEDRRNTADGSERVHRADPGVDGADEKRRPLITADHGAVVGAAITAAASLLIYSFNQIRHIDERLDRLEQEARILIDGQGSIRPSKEALQNYFHLEALRERVERLEAK